MWFWRSRDRFSLEEFKYLNEQLQKVTVINDSNKDFVVETLRSMAELIIWGDQHDPLFFDYFMEKQVMAHFLKILNDGNKNSSIAVQLLQTLSIIIGNIRNEQAIYYLFSNEYINYLITYDFDFRHEEVLAYYIIFLRTISVKLDKTTVSFFIKTKDDKVTSFPLYSEAIKFFHHEEGMVRIAVRTLTLNVYNVNDEGIQQFVMSPPVVGYFSDLVTFLRQQSIKLDGLVAEASRAPKSATTIGRLEAAIAEIGDLLFYFNDIMGSGIPGLNELMSRHILNLLVKPVLVPSLCPNTDLAVNAEVMQVSSLCSMYLLSRLLQILKKRPLINLISAALLQIPQSTSAVPRENGGEKTGDSGMSEDVLLSASSREDGNDDRPSTAESMETSSLDYDHEDSTSPGGQGERLDVSHPIQRDSPPESPREALILYLLHEDDKLVLASLCVIVALLQSKDLDDMLLDALGILPRRKRHKHMLLQAIMGTQSEEEPELFADPPVQLEEDISLRLKNFKIEDFVGVVKVPGQHNGQKIDCNFPGAKSRRHRQEVLDGLLQLLSRRPPPCAEALWHAGWLLRQLLPQNEHILSADRLALLDSAYLAAREDIMKEVSDCWSDVIPTVLTDEWKVCRKALDSPALEKDSSFVLLPRDSDSLQDGEVSSSVIGERMRTAVKVFVALHQMRNLLSEGTWTEAPALGWPKDKPESALLQVGLHLSSVKVGAELDLTQGKAMACRVAFERGKERSVFLMVVHKAKDPASWLLLVEELGSRRGYGVVRVIAPLAGSKPRVDDDHPRWLHLRIRSPHWPSADAGKMGTNGPRVKRLVDGRWTLAFADPDKCRKAESLVVQMVDIQAALVKQVLSPLMDRYVGSEAERTPT